MKKAHCDIYRRVVAEVEHEVKADKPKLDSIAKAIKQLREHEKGLK